MSLWQDGKLQIILPAPGWWITEIEVRAALIKLGKLTEVIEWTDEGHIFKLSDLLQRALVIYKSNRIDIPLVDYLNGILGS